MRTTTASLETGDQPLALRRWTPDAPPRLAVQILHGMAEHSARYDALARRLVADGCDVWSHDHRGHGLTAPERSALGHFADRDGWGAVVEDAWRVHEEMARTSSGTPRVVIAHSMGSFVAQTMMGQFAGHGTLASGIAGVVLCGTSGPDLTVAPGRWIARAECLRLGPRQPSPVLERMAWARYNDHITPRRTRFDWLSRDPAVVDAYVADPLCGFALTTQAWCDVLGGLQHLGSPAHAAGLPGALPVLMITGDADPLSRQTRLLKPLRKQFARAGIDLTERVYAGARHELFNETNRDEVIADVLQWLSAIRM